MKLIFILVFLSVAVLSVMVYQAVLQEMNLHKLKVFSRVKTADLMKKEQSIAELKKTLQELKPQLNAAHTMAEEMKVKKDDLQKETNDLEANLKTCTNERGEAEKRKTEIAETVNKLKTEHEGAKQKAQTEIQDLKKQNLDREKAICAFVDTTNAEAQKLCGLPMSPQ